MKLSELGWSTKRLVSTVKFREILPFVTLSGLIWSAIAPLKF